MKQLERPDSSDQKIELAGFRLYAGGSPPPPAPPEGPPPGEPVCEEPPPEEQVCEEKESASEPGPEEEAPPEEQVREEPPPEEEEEDPEEVRDELQDSERSNERNLDAIYELDEEGSEEAKEVADELKADQEKANERLESKQEEIDACWDNIGEEEKEIDAGMEPDPGVNIATGENTVQISGKTSASYAKDAVNFVAGTASWVIGRSAFFYAGVLKGLGDWVAQDVDSETGEPAGGVSWVNKLFTIEKSKVTKALGDFADQAARDVFSAWVGAKLAKACGKDEAMPSVKQLALDVFNPFARLTLMGEGGVTIMGLLPKWGNVTIGSLCESVRVMGKKQVEILGAKQVKIAGSEAGEKGGIRLFQSPHQRIDISDSRINLDCTGKDGYRIDITSRKDVWLRSYETGIRLFGNEKIEALVGCDEKSIQGSRGYELNHKDNFIRIGKPKREQLEITDDWAQLFWEAGKQVQVSSDRVLLKMEGSQLELKSDKVTIKADKIVLDGELEVTKEAKFKKKVEAPNLKDDG